VFVVLVTGLTTVSRTWSCRSGPALPSVRP